MLTQSHSVRKFLSRKSAGSAGNDFGSHYFPQIAQTGAENKFRAITANPLSAKICGISGKPLLLRFI